MIDRSHAGPGWLQFSSLLRLWVNGIGNRIGAIARG